MDAICVGDLLSAPGHPQVQEHIDSLPALGPEATRVLLSGVPRRCARRCSVHSTQRAGCAPDTACGSYHHRPATEHAVPRAPTAHSGKTSLLLHLSCAAAGRGARVAWLARQAPLEARPPLLPQGVPRGAALLGSISFK